MRAFVLMAGVAALAAGAASASEPAAAPGARNDDNRVVCRSQAKTGTRFATRVCQSRAERERIAEAARRTGSEMANAPQINPHRE